MSPFSRIYKSIRNILNVNVPNVAQVDMDYGQLRLYEGRAALKFPCVLLDFPGWSFSNIGGLAQIGQGPVIVTIAFAAYSRTDSKATDSMLDRGLEFLDIEQEVCEWLHGFAPAQSMGYLIRQTATSANLPDGIRTRVITFALELEDCSLARVYTEGAKPPLETATQIAGSGG